MIRKELVGAQTRMTLDADGGRVQISMTIEMDGEEMIFKESFSVEDFIEFGQSLTLNERADSEFVSQIKSDAITNAKLLRGDFNSL